MSKKNLNKKLKILFKNLKIRKGDKILIHSNISGLFQYYNTDKDNICNLFFVFLKKYIGKNGTIIIPTYNYKFTKKIRFDLKNTPSEVGYLGNHLLKKNWKKRTLDPVFSHIIYGNVGNFRQSKINTNAFGADSLFSHVNKGKFKILCFCCPTNTITFIHYLEYIFKVPYRFLKKFSGKFIVNGNEQIITYDYYVGKKNYNYGLKENKINKFINNQNFLISNFGKFQCFLINTNYLYNKIKKNIKKDNKFLITK